MSLSSSQSLPGGPYQRFAFENLSAEAQHEMLEKHQRQLIQKIFLDSQMREKSKNIDEPSLPRRKYAEDPKPDPIQSASVQPSSGPSDEIQAILPPSERPAPHIFTTFGPLLADRSRPSHLNQKPLSISLNPASVHAAFSSLRSQILGQAPTR